jgi:hypothetical protein
MGMAPNPGKSAFLLVIAVAAATALAGCYTVLKHPPTLNLAGGADSGVGDCYQCHSTEGPAHAYDPLFAAGFDYFNDYWYPFYAYPWWYREYWYHDRYDHAGGGGGAGSDNPIPQEKDSRRRLWGRGGSFVSPPSLPPPYAAPAPGLPAGSTGTPPPGGSQPPQPETGQQPGRTMKDEAPPPSTPPPPPPNSSGGDDKKKDAEETKKKEKDSRKEAGSNVWSRGGGRKS